MGGASGKLEGGAFAGKALEEARRLAARRRYAEAARYFKKARSQGALFSGLCGEALCLYKTGRLSDALALAHQAAETNTTSGRPHFIAALALKDAGRYDEAIASLDNALARGYRRSVILYHRGAAHFLGGRLSQAERDFKEAVREEPASAAAFYNLGVVQVHRSKWREAAAAFSACAELDPAGLPHYNEIIFAIGRAQAGEEFYFRGHRMKNMLALLADRCQRRSQESPSEDAQGNALEAVVERLEKVLAEMAELLSFVKQEPLDLDVWDIHNIIDTALLSASDALASIQVHKHYGADIPGVVCDGHDISEAFLNIMLNAAEAMGEDGTLTIRTGWDGHNTVRVEFEDTGGGVRTDPPEKVFQFAFTTRPGGTGLGLCQASRAVEEHGGRILVEDGVRGARFAVELPLRAATGERIEEIGLRPDLCENIGLLWAEGPDRPIEVSADS